MPAAGPPITGQDIAGMLRRIGATHVVTVPDTTTGAWLPDIRSTSVQLVQVCREGEAWGIAAGLYLGGATPIVLIQCTGLFESGDALRNVIHDYRLPLYSLIGYRSYLNSSSLPGDTCLKFTEPILDAWQLNYLLIERGDQMAGIEAHFRTCQEANQAGVALIAEGRA